MNTEATTGWTVYDPLTGPTLDASRWTPEKLHLPEGGEHIPLDPNAAVSVGAGQVRVTIPSFSLSHDTFQPADDVKYLMFSADTIELPDDGPALFGVDLAVRNIGGDAADARAAMATLNVVDLADSGCIFDICATSARVFALHERLVFDAGAAAFDFSHLVESPLLDIDGSSSDAHSCEIMLDRGSSRAAWRVNGQPVYEVTGARIPKRVRIGFGIFTLVPIRDGQSRCLRGQGLEATWRGFRYQV